MLTNVIDVVLFKEIPKAEEPDADKSEKKDALPKLPPGVAKMGGLGALGGRNLLEEMRKKQEKRNQSSSPNEVRHLIVIVMDKIS